MIEEEGGVRLVHWGRGGQASAQKGSRCMHLQRVRLCSVSFYFANCINRQAFGEISFIFSKQQRVDHACTRRRFITSN